MISLGLVSAALVVISIIGIRRASFCSSGPPVAALCLLAIGFLGLVAFGLWWAIRTVAHLIHLS